LPRIQLGKSTRIPLLPERYALPLSGPSACGLAPIDLFIHKYNLRICKMAVRLGCHVNSQIEIRFKHEGMPCPRGFRYEAFCLWEE